VVIDCAAGPKDRIPAGHWMQLDTLPTYKGTYILEEVQTGGQNTHHTLKMPINLVFVDMRRYALRTQVNLQNA
jgi:hypothetical protein